MIIDFLTKICNNYFIDIGRKYYDEKKIDDEKLTYFHLFATAISKVMYNKPLLNRFVINGR